MNKLTSKICDACQTGAPQVSATEINEFLQQIPDWEVKEMNGINHLIRYFKFSNFRKALDFTNLVGELAEAENHHPEIITEWGKVTVSWWTHKINGLHLNDFVAAAKTDQHYSE